MDIRGYFESKNLSEVLTKKLSRREVEVLNLYTIGNLVGEVAKMLMISENTVNTHLRKIISKIIIDDTANKKGMLYIFSDVYRKEIMKMGGYTNGK